MSDVRVLDDAPWLRSGPTARVLGLLNGDGEEARVVGGAVRNALLKLPIGEIDIATTAVPSEVIRRAKAGGIKSVPTGIDHGTVTLVVDAQPFEITTLREDTETFGRKAKVAFGRDWVTDAKRRDFTINGMSVDAAGVVHEELYVFGGEGARMFHEVEVYDPRGRRWERLPPMPTPRHGFAASVIDKRIYLPGGATQPGFGATRVNSSRKPFCF